MECIFSARLGSPVAEEGRHVQETRQSGLVSPVVAASRSFVATWARAPVSYRGRLTQTSSRTDRRSAVVPRSLAGNAAEISGQSRRQSTGGASISVAMILSASETNGGLTSLGGNEEATKE